MKAQIKLGFTDYTALVFIPDPASTDGSGKTGLVAANLTVSYVRVETDNDVTVTDVTSSLNNLAALTTAHTDWGLLEVSNTLAPGLYRLDIADAVFAAGAWSAVVYVMITTSAAAASPMEFDLVAFDKLDTVRMGLTALPNAAADAAGGLPISDAGGLDLDAQKADVAAILVDTGTTLDVRIPAALVGGRMDASVGAMAANVLTAAAINDGAIDTATFAAGTTIPRVTLADTLTTYTGNTPQTGDVFPLASTEIADIKAKTDQLTFTAANKVDATVQAAGDVTAAAANKIADHVLRRTYANARASADGDAVAFRSLLGAVGKLVNKWAISGSTLTVYQEDDATSTAPGGTQTVTGTAGADPITTLDTN